MDDVALLGAQAVQAPVNESHIEFEHGLDPTSAQSAIQTYSLEEVARMVLPPEWTDGVRWLARRLNRGQIRGYRVGRIWRMTEDHVDDLIERFTNHAARPAITPPAPSSEPTSVADGLSRRSRRRLLRR